MESGLLGMDGLDGLEFGTCSNVYLIVPLGSVCIMLVYGLGNVPFGYLNCLNGLRDISCCDVQRDALIMP